MLLLPRSLSLIRGSSWLGKGIEASISFLHLRALRDDPTDSRAGSLALSAVALLKPIRRQCYSGVSPS